MNKNCFKLNSRNLLYEYFKNFRVSKNNNYFENKNNHYNHEHKTPFNINKKL